jgi:hypothetical protein
VRQHVLPPTVTTRLMYVVTVNGRSTPLSRYRPPSFRVRPGQHLRITVAVTVPTHATVTALSLGISAEGFGGSPQHPPACGRSWLAPASSWPQDGTPSGGTGASRKISQSTGPGASLDLISVWSDSQADVAQTIAALVLSPAR